MAAILIRKKEMEKAFDTSDSEKDDEDLRGEEVGKEQEAE